MAENGINKRKKARKSSSPTKAALGVPGEFDTPQPARGQPAPRRPRRAVAARATAHAVEAAAQGQEEAPQGLRPRRHINKPKRLCEVRMFEQCAPCVSKSAQVAMASATCLCIYMLT